MNIHQYQPFWDRISPLMTAKLIELAQALAGKTEYSLSEIYEGGDEEFHKSLNLNRGDVTALGIDFRLLDGDVHGAEEGFGIKLDLTGYTGLGLGGYAPSNYTKDAFTDDLDELVRRVEDLDVAVLAAHIVDVTLQDERLLREIASAGA